MTQISVDGRRRYEEKIPPGYMDQEDKAVSAKVWRFVCLDGNFESCIRVWKRCYFDYK